MAKVVNLPASENFNVEQALKSSLQVDGLEKVIIIGQYEDGSQFIRSSKMTCAEAIFACEKAKLWALGI